MKLENISLAETNIACCNKNKQLLELLEDQDDFICVSISLVNKVGGVFEYRFTNIKKTLELIDRFIKNEQCELLEALKEL